MHLQGKLQTVFDVLEDMGVIDRVIGRDWEPFLSQIEERSETLTSALKLVNQFAHDRDILSSKLRTLDEKTLDILAMEVAREYADFHAREIIH